MSRMVEDYSKEIYKLPGYSGQVSTSNLVARIFVDAREEPAEPGGPGGTTDQ